jgi:hypothetical protein
MRKDKKMDEIFGEPIFVYTAEQAVEDGILVDVTELASQIFKVGCDMPWKCRISANVHSLCTPPKSSNQDYTGRLWDVLNVARHAIRNAEQGSTMVEFTCKLGRSNHKLWACLDTTSGPAIHIITPKEY